jgi:hypothetical protein
LVKRHILSLIFGKNFELHCRKPNSNENNGRFDEVKNTQTGNKERGRRERERER